MGPVSRLNLVRDRLALALGSPPAGREDLVGTMIARHARDRVGYWLQLGLSMGIATLGLVLGSTGVVIGAMLISPLMSPLVELGMGLAVGSPILFARSFVRTLASVSFVVAGAALITVTLPFQQITSEIAARTSPTALDLFVAAFCALAAVYTTIRSTSDTTTAAAGTAIGISLVPPLCVAGYGIGSGAMATFAGAMLLFTANFSAILLVSVMSFFGLGFDTVDVNALERQAITGGDRVTRLGRWAHALLGGTRGRAVRVLLPLLIVAAVYLPLRQALEEVSWEIRTRGEIVKLLANLPIASKAIRSSTVVERHNVSVRMAIIADGPMAAQVQTDLQNRIRALTGVTPTVEVLAVPDAESLQRAADVRLAASQATTSASALRRVDQELDTVLAELWPSATAGALLEWRLVRTERETRLDVVHLGQELGPSGVAILEAELKVRLDTPLTVRDRAYSSVVRTFETNSEAWLLALAGMTRALQDVPALRACVTVPEAIDAGAPEERKVPALAEDLFRSVPPDRVEIRVGVSRSLALTTSACGSGPPALPADAGR